MVETVALLASGAAAGASATEVFRSRRLINRLRAVALCSHELRGALTAIGAALSRLERPSGTSERSRVEALRHGYDRALSVARDLEAARGALPARSARHPSWWTSRSVAGRVVRRVERVAAVGRPAGRARLARRRDARPRVSMRLTQALDNLVANAVEHGRGPVTVTGAHERQPRLGLRARPRGGPDAPALRRSPALLAGAPRSRSGRRTPRRRVARRHAASGPGSVRLGDRGPAAGGGRSGSGAQLPARLLFPAGRAPAPPRRDAAPPRCRHARRVGDLRRPGRFGSGPLRGRDRVSRWAARPRRRGRTGHSSRDRHHSGASHPRRWPNGRCHSGSRHRGALGARGRGGRASRLPPAWRPATTSACRSCGLPRRAPGARAARWSGDARLVEVAVAGARTMSQVLRPGARVDVLITTDRGRAAPRTFLALQRMPVVGFESGAAGVAR